jgi:tRNA A37 methylthiotransferase MiaB
MKPEVNGKIAKERLHEIEALINEKNIAFRRAFGGSLDVLVESYKDGVYHGLDQHFNKIIINSKEDLVGNWVTVESYEVGEDTNYAHI